MRFWNSFIMPAHNQKVKEPNNLKVCRSKKTKQNLCWSIYGFMCGVLCITVCPFVNFVLFFSLRFTASDCTFRFFKLLFKLLNIKPCNIKQTSEKTEGRSRMDNTETRETLGIRHRTKTSKAKNITWKKDEQHSPHHYTTDTHSYSRLKGRQFMFQIRI